MSVSAPLRLAVFDLDGTLVDSGQIIEAAMADAFARLSLERPESAAVRRVIGLPLDVAIARLSPSVEAAVHADLCDQYKDAFFSLRAGGTVEEALFPGVVEVLDRLEAEGWLLGIATSKSMRGLRAALGHFGLERYFVTLRTGDQGPGKPAPDMLLNAMHEAGADAVDTVMIGDTTYDMEMAVSAGVAPIGVAWGNHEATALTAAGARAVLDRLPGLPDVADGILAGKTLA